MRSARVTVALLCARVRHAGPRWLLVALGISLAVVLPVLAATLTATTVDAAVRQGIAARPPGERSVTVSYNGFPDDAALAAYDRTVRSLLPRMTGGPVQRQLIYREMADPHNRPYVLAAADGLAHRVRLTAGRWPTSCSPTRCEVVSLSTSGSADPGLDPSLGLVVVGHAVRTDPLLLTGTFDPGAGVPLLLADSVQAAAHISSLELRQRSIGWVAALDLRTLRRLGVDGWVATSAGVADALWTAHPGLVLTTLDSALDAEHARAAGSAQRFTVLGAATSLLILGSAVIGGAALRSEHEAFSGALRRRGASRRLLGTLVAGEASAAAAAGLLLGLALGFAASMAVAAQAGLAAWQVSATAVRTALPAAAVLTIGAAVLIGTTLTAGRGAWGTTSGRGARRAVDALAAGCACVALLLAARGGVSASDRLDDPLLSALPVLVLLTGALILARVWQMVTRAALGLLPHRALGARLGLAAATGRPLRPAATAAVLSASVAVCVFAGAYGATLDRGAGDQAAYAVPLDAQLTVGQNLDRPLDVATPGVIAALLPGASAFRVLRVAGSLRATAGQSDAVSLLGLDAAALPRLDRWRAVTGGGQPASVVAARLHAGPATLAGLVLPPGRRLLIATPGDSRPDQLSVSALLTAPDGREAAVPLAASQAASTQRGLSADLAAWIGNAPGPATWRDATGQGGVPLRLLALTLRQRPDDATRTQHALGERRAGLDLPAGHLNLGAVSVDGVPAAGGSPWRGWSGPGLTLPPGAGNASVRYELTTGAVVLSGEPTEVGQPTSPLPVAADPVTAASARAGLVTLTVSGRAVAARVVAVLARFPTVPDGVRFAVTDRAALARLADLAEPGTGEPIELWLALPTPASARSAAEKALGSAPFDRLAIQRADATRQALLTDAVAVGARRLLAIGALLTLFVAACAVALLVVADRRDDAAQAYAWEADGVLPGTLRSALWWRAAAVALTAVPGGVVVGLVLTRLTARLVAVTATAQTPQPPLEPGTSGGWGVYVAVFGVAGALLVATLVAAGAYRESVPLRTEGSAL